MIRRIPREILERPVEGVHLKPGTLADQIDGRSTLIVFLRHIG